MFAPNIIRIRHAVTQVHAHWWGELSIHVHVNIALLNQSSTFASCSQLAEETNVVNSCCVAGCTSEGGRGLSKSIV